MNPETLNPYNNLPDDHELVEHYQPKFLARDGDHLVYEVANHPDIVIKVSTFNIKDILYENADNGEALDFLSETQKERLQKEVDEKNRQIKILRQYFGKEHTLIEKRFLMKIPVTKVLIDEIFKKDWKNRLPPEGLENIKELWSSVVLQKRTRETENPDHLGLYSGGFLEETEFNKLEYKNLNNAFVSRHQTTDEDLESFFRLQDNPKTHALKDIVLATEKNPDLKKVLKELMIKIISYEEDTGNILAMNGKDNIILYQHSGVWNYLFMDVLPLHNEPIFKDAQDSIHRYAKGEKLTEYDKILVMKALNFTRIVNGMATSLGIAERLNLTSEGDGDIDFDTLLKRRS